MSRFAIEKVLWEISQDSERAEKFRANPERYLAANALDPDEVEMIKALDVRAMVAHKVHPMLTMRAWQILRGRDQMPAYFKALGPAK